MIDTGCGTSIVSKHLVHKFGLKIEKLKQGQNLILFAANGTQIHVLGSVTISIKLGGLDVPFDFLVVNDLNQNIILGVDFLESTRAQINCAEHTVIFYDDLVQVNILSKEREIIACLDRETR